MNRAVLGVSLAAAVLGATANAAEARKLIYLHGRIVQDQQSARPKHPEWGYYELEAILATFRERGFDVTGEIRPKANTLSQSADRVVGQVTGLHHGFLYRPLPEWVEPVVAFANER